MGREAHEDPRRRYVAAVFAGLFYLIVGIFGATVVALFLAFPAELVAAIAGLALLATIGNGLASAVGSENQREPALVTFLVTASGIAPAGIGSAFWGLVAGVDDPGDTAGGGPSRLARPRKERTWRTWKGGRGCSPRSSWASAW